MKPLGSTAFAAFFNYAGRVFLTLVIIFLFLFAFGVVLKFHSLFLASQSQHAPSIYVSNAAQSQTHNNSLQPFWPEFPRSAPGNVQSAIINGTQILTEEWEDNVSAPDVLAYYREQMTARGWRDATEETYSLQPELHEVATAPPDENYVNNYRSVMNTTVVLSRNDWTMHVTAVPGKKDSRKTAVKIYAAATPSFQKFTEKLEAPFATGHGNSGQTLDAVQQSSSEKYHTTIKTETAPPTQAFQAELAALNAQGWQPAVFLPREKTPGGFFVWLTRGQQYAALSVKSLPAGNGSSITFTEVTPK